MLIILTLTFGLHAAGSGYHVEDNVITVHRFKGCQALVKPRPIAPEMLKFFYQQVLDQLAEAPVERALVRRDRNGRIVRWFADGSWGNLHLAIARDPDGRPRRITLTNVDQAPLMQVTSVERVRELEAALHRRFAHVEGQQEEGLSGYDLAPLEPDLTL